MLKMSFYTLREYEVVKTMRAEMKAKANELNDSKERTQEQVDFYNYY